MKVACVKLESMSPYSQSRMFRSVKDRDETHEDFESRCWRERLHVSPSGNVQIPPMAFKNCIAEAAKYKSIQIPGKGKTTYTKHFEAGVMVVEPLVLPLRPEDVECDALHVPSDGRRGGSKRVLRRFPVIQQWEGEVEFIVFDEIITPEVFEQHLNDAGQFIGIGRFRPRNNGYYGRFRQKSITWRDA